MKGLSLLLVACAFTSNAFATAISCRGQGALSDMYISIYSGSFSSAQHSCLDNKDAYNAGVILHLPSVQPQDTIKHNQTDYYIVPYRNKNLVLQRRSYQQTFLVSRFPIQEWRQIHADVEALKLSQQAHAEELQKRMNAQPAVFECQSLNWGNYMAPCDKTDDITKGILNGSIAPASKAAMAKEIGEYLLENSNTSYRSVSDVIRKLNQERFGFAD